MFNISARLSRPGECLDEATRRRSREQMSDNIDAHQVTSGSTFARIAGAEMIELFSINSPSSCHLWRVTPSNEMSSHRQFGRRGGRDRVSGIGILEKTLIRQHLTQHREVIPAHRALGDSASSGWESGTGRARCPSADAT